MLQLIERLKCKRVRQSTSNNYLSIWRQFNRFVIKLDWKPDTWEERTAMFCAFLIQDGKQSTTIKSYVSAIKAILKEDGYEWSDNLVLLNSLMRACKLVNDTVKCRLPINKNLLEMILFETQRYFQEIGQVYLEILYKNLFSIMYYGMMRIGEVAYSEHTLKAKDIHIGKNKDKILIVLYTSKTHGKASLPQKIKIETETQGRNERKTTHFFCPFELLRQFVTLRGDYKNDEEQFFVFADNSPVRPEHVRKTLRFLLEKLSLNPKLYDCHSMRAGRTVDLAKMKISITELKAAGRWRSNAVYRYLK